MIGLIQNKTIYEYDIRSLILAFMLGEKIELTDHVDSIYDFILEVQYKDQEIDMKLYKKGELEDEIQLFGDYEDKKLFKNQLKRGIYQLFSKALNKQLPWGTLTGIRPTKIAFDGYKKGESSEEIIHKFQKDYLASKEKASLCTETVQKERKLLKTFPYKEGYSLYVGIPFCPSTCLYCSFTSYSIDQYENIVQDYLDALFKELDFVKSNLEQTINATNILKKHINNTFHASKRGVNVIIQHDKPKDIIWKVKKELPINHHAFITKCPNYNRLKEKGLVIEVKNLDYSSLKKENLDKIIEVVNNQL